MAATGKHIVDEKRFSVPVFLHFSDIFLRN
jgi:hypothetical protein